MLTSLTDASRGQLTPPAHTRRRHPGPCRVYDDGAEPVVGRLIAGMPAQNSCELVRRLADLVRARDDPVFSGATSATRARTLSNRCHTAASPLAPPQRNTRNVLVCGGNGNVVATPDASIGWATSRGRSMPYVRTYRLIYRRSPGRLILAGGSWVGSVRTDPLRAGVWPRTVACTPDGLRKILEAMVVEVGADELMIRDLTPTPGDRLDSCRSLRAEAHRPDRRRPQDHSGTPTK